MCEKYYFAWKVVFVLLCRITSNVILSANVPREKTNLHDAEVPSLIGNPGVQDTEMPRQINSGVQNTKLQGKTISDEMQNAKVPSLIGNPGVQDTEMPKQINSGVQNTKLQEKTISDGLQTAEVPTRIGNPGVQDTGVPKQINSVVQNTKLQEKTISGGFQDAEVPRRIGTPGVQDTEVPRQINSGVQNTQLQEKTISGGLQDVGVPRPIGNPGVQNTKVPRQINSGVQNTQLQEKTISGGLQDAKVPVKMAVPGLQVSKERERGDSVHSQGTGQADTIKELPGVDFRIKFKQYSGYLNAGKDKFMFYWFTESQRSPTEDPVILWFNGGPGCSSVDGLLSELGPFAVKNDGEHLKPNPFSWNRFANLLFLETPVGVGFSYSLDKNYTTSDNQTAEENYLALQDFYRKFPQFLKNEFYVTGESYAGVYIPNLCTKIYKGDSKINFKGFSIGNAVLNDDISSDSLIFFGYFHGLVGIQRWENVTKLCCKGGVASKKTCKFSGNLTDDCSEAVNIATEHIQAKNMNNYNIIANCTNSTAAKHSRYLSDKRNLNALTPKHKRLQLMEGITPCIDSMNTTHYLNVKDVQKALHVSDRSTKWESCNDDIFKTYDKQFPSMKQQILDLVKPGKVRVLLYNGDVDTVCNYLGDEWFVNSLDLPVEREYDVWTHHNQIGGFVKYFRNLTFSTVRGSGHMVPTDKPAVVYHMLTRFIEDQPF